MSFRFRALALVMLIAVASTTLTAWLTLSQAARQVRESVTAGQQEVARITADLREFGLSRSGWQDVATAVRDLSARTGQRIRVVGDSGTLLADSDVLAGREPRQVAGPPVLVDPRASLHLVAGENPTVVLPRLTLFALQRYRTAVAYGRCLAQAGAGVSVRTDAEGIPIVSTGQQTGCVESPPADNDISADAVAVSECSTATGDQLVACLQEVFARRAGTFAPERVQVYLGAVDQSGRQLSAGPAVAVAVAVALAAIVAALLLSRGVLRPVRALTRASRRVGAGDLTQRVPASGRDEIAELGRSFNRMAEELQGSEDRQRRLVGDVAHELRTPLANLRGYLEALRDGVLEPSTELLTSLHEEVLLQQRIVDDLQDLALAEAGALTYHRTGVDVAELLETCLVAHRPAATNAGIALAVEASATAHVHADPDRLRQALGNLITNAVRATPSGGAIALRLACTDGRVAIEVADTGSGISEEHLPHVFDRFWRADPARGRATGGSGLGLTIARQIVRDHGGEMTVTSDPGAGTTFVITLPVAK